MTPISNEKTCKCKQHQFILKPLSQNLHHSRKVQLSLCEILPKHPRKKVLKSKRKCCRGYPVLNMDKNYATPAFILESQKQHFLENRNIYLKDHSRKARQYEQVATDIYFPAPRSNYEYCNVCCSSYVNYIQHISAPQHHKQIKMNKFNDYILDLEQTFRKSHNDENGKRSFEQRCIQIQDDSQFSIAGSKKLKTEQKTSPTDNGQLFSENRFQQFKNYYQFNNYMFQDPIINTSNQKKQDQVVNYQFPTTANYSSPQYLNFNPYCQQNYTELMSHFYNAGFGMKFQAQVNNDTNNFYNHGCQYSPQFQHFMAQNNPYQQPNHVYSMNMDPSYIKYNTIPTHCNYQAPLIQSPYLCFNNFNVSVFPTW